MSNGQPIRVVNHWGNLEIRAAERPGSFRIQAAVQRIGREPPPAPVFRRQRVDGVAELIIDFPGARRSPMRTGRVDVALYVPAGHPLTVETLDGLVKAKKTANPLHVITTDGPVQIINDGPIHVRSQSSRVQLRPMYDRWSTIDARSERGAVVAFLPTSAAFDLEVAGTEDVYSAFPLHARSETLAATHRGRETPVNRVRLTSGRAVEVHEAHLAKAVAVTGAAAETETNP